MPQPPPIVLYHYSGSPYARRVVWYMQLRGISYAQCMQPHVMPRPDIASLGVNYRRIPILSIGRDVYLDTRLIIRKLDQLYPSLPTLRAYDNAEQRAIEKLLEFFTIDGGIFSRAAQLMPTDLPLLQKPGFFEDRVDYAGPSFTKENLDRSKPEALNEIKNAIAFLESTLLADGRDWVLKTERPTLADIEAIWPFHWLTGLPGALPADQVSVKQYPRVFAWIARFQEAVYAAKAGAAKPRTLSGGDACALILGSRFNDNKDRVDQSDALVRAQGLGKGDAVKIWPIDTGSSHKQTGRLVCIDGDEIVLETTADTGGIVRVHAPRHGFRVIKDGGGAGPRL